MNTSIPWICPACGCGNAPTTATCSNCIARQAFAPLPIVPWEPQPQPWPSVIAIPPAPSAPCAFDRLPPGIYGLVCMCPKCTPTFYVDLSRVNVCAGGGVAQLQVFTSGYNAGAAAPNGWTLPAPPTCAVSS